MIFMPDADPDWFDRECYRVKAGVLGRSLRMVVEAMPIPY